jgi:hypothetical protein
MAHSSWSPSFLRKKTVVDLIFIQIIPSFLFIVACPYLVLLVSRLLGTFSDAFFANVIKYRAEELVEQSATSLFDRLLYNFWSDVHTSTRGAAGVLGEKKNMLLNEALK